MKQRAMIAGALACGPEILLADEPTTALDVTVQREILDLLRRLGRERGLAVIFVLHDLGAVASLCSRALVMCRGRIVEEGPLLAVVTRPAHEYTRALIAAHPDRLAPQATGREALAAAPLIEAEKLCVRYGGRSFADVLLGRHGGVAAVQEASFSVAPGEALGVVGESGSGKSTIARALVGLVRPESGHLRHEGRPLASGGRGARPISGASS